MYVNGKEPTLDCGMRLQYGVEWTRVIKRAIFKDLQLMSSRRL